MPACSPISPDASPTGTPFSYDQRGHSRSTLDGEPADIPVTLHADDAAAILAAVGTEPAYVYGNSGGGTIGLELVARHPGLVRTLVAHETFLMELLPDAARWRSAFDEIDELYRTEGVFPAMGKFGELVEEGGPKYSEEMQQTPPTTEGQGMMARMTGNFDLFIAHELRLNGGYVPDVDALRNGSTRIVSAAVGSSGEQAARRSAFTLAERLRIPVTYLPGAHGGWDRIRTSSPTGCTRSFRAHDHAAPLSRRDLTPPRPATSPRESPRTPRVRSSNTR